MLKTVIAQCKIKMATERKVRETLAKKLSGKKVPRKIEANFEQAENKSKLFKETKNRENYIESVEKQVPVRIKSSKFSIVEKAESKDNIIQDNKKTPTKRNLRKVVTKLVDDTKSSIEIITTKSIKINNLPSENKIPIKKVEEPSTSKKIKQEFSGEKWEPPNWKLMLDNIRSMRSKAKAPVDTMGCHKCADENADEKTQRFHKLIALMLSSQTKDETTYHAMLRLREQNLTPEAICKMKISVLENILYPVSFYKNKAKYMQQTSKILVEKYNSDIPNNINELVALPGVGPKMAHICMATAWHKVTGIGVDVHVHRISNRMGWLPKATKEPEQTRLALESWLPKHLWSEVNHLLVGFGQTICTPVKPGCIECLNLKICPSAPKIIKKEVITTDYIV